jgi:hypothetical protein
MLIFWFHVLVRNKVYNIYKKFIKKLKEASGTHRRNPKQITCHYGQALIKALGFHFPTATIKGCFFHYGHCIWRKFLRETFILKYLKLSILKMKSLNNLLNN